MLDSVDVQFTWPQLLTQLVNGQDLSAEETSWAMNQIMSGEASTVHTVGLLVALRAKGETVTELAALADTMLEHAVRLEVPGRSVDIVGTGGDRANTVNISTMAALVVAGTGLQVVKHGNRAASSASGSADVIEALGIRLTLPHERLAQMVSEIGITFCFALQFHPAFRHAGPPRRELGIATIFNFLGPLTNPAQPQASAVGVYDGNMAPLLAGVFAKRGSRALVFRNDDGLDELAATSTSQIWEVVNGEVIEHQLDPVRELGLTPITIADLRGADADHNAQVARDLLNGRTGPVRETVLLNAAATIVADGSNPALGNGDLVSRLRNGLEIAATSIDSGRASAVLENWRIASTRD